MLRICWTSSLLLATLALAACSDGGGGTTTPPTPTISLALGSSALTLTQGQNNTVTVSVTRGGGYTGAVDLSLEGAPTGLSGTFDPASLANGTTSSTLTLNAATNATPGPHNLTVRASGQGVEEKAAALTLTVQEAPRIALSVDPATLEVQQGTNGTVALSLARTNFPGAVELTLEGAPAGVSGSFDPARPTGSAATSTLTLAVDASAAPGTTDLVIRARGQGIEEKTATVALTITPMPAYALTLNPTALSVAQGASGTVQVQLARSNFPGAVALSVSGAPDGVTASVSSTSVTDAAATLTVDVGAGAAPGTYTLTVTGQAQGLADRTAALQLTVTEPASFTLSVSPTNLSVAQGQSASAAVNITRTGGFTGAVVLSVTGAPPGLTATINPTSTTGDSATLNLTAAANVAPGSYTLTVSGSSSIRSAAPGQPNPTATLTVQVTAAQSSGFSLSLSPASLTMQQGQSGSATVNIARSGGFSGAVALSVSGAPAGLTATINPTSATGNSAMLNLSASANVAPGSYTLTVSGNAAGVGTRTATLAVTITAAPPSGGGNTVWQFCGTGGELPVWVAVQDGNGAWSRVQGTGNRYTFDIQSARGGIAYVTYRFGNLPVLNFIYATREELQAQGNVTCGTKTVHVPTAGAGGVTLANSYSIEGTVILRGIPDGPHDLVAGGAWLVGQNPPRWEPRVIIRRGINPPDNATLPVLDFGTSEAVPADTHNLTLGGDDMGPLTALILLQSTYHTGTTNGPLYFSEPSIINAPPYRWTSVPASLRQSGDRTGLSAHVVDLGAPGQVHERNASEYFIGAGDRTLSFGPRLSGAPAYSAVTATPYRRPRVVYTLPAPYTSLVHVGYWSSNYLRSVSVIMTQGWLGGNTVDYTVPDLSSVPGFDTSWGLLSGLTSARFTAEAWSGIRIADVPGILVERNRTWLDDDVFRMAPNARLRLPPGVTSASIRTAGIFTPESF